MKIHRFIGNFDINLGIISVSDPELLNQVRNVLKLKAGERVILADGRLNEGSAVLREFGKNELTFEIDAVSLNKNEPSIQAVLFCAILKKENFELVCQKATEVGIYKIVPLITERTIKLGLNKERLNKIIREAAEQSGRGIVPEVVEPMEVEKAIELAKENEVNVFLSLSGQSSLNKSYKKIGIWIGPEGGWSESEENLSQTSGFVSMNLGSLTLRAETAAIIGTYKAIHGLL